MAEAYIYDSIRTPRGKGKKDGALHEVRAVKLLAQVLEVLKERNQLDTTLIDDVIIGCVTQIGDQGADIAKTAVLEAGYDHTVSGVTLNRFCGSGLEAINQAAAYIMSGMTDMIIAGGVESMSRVPMGSDGGAIFSDPEMIANHYIVPQGISADLIATHFGYSRVQLDEFAAASHARASQAWRENRFARSVIPVKDINHNTLLDQDEIIRPGTTVDTLATLNPAFATIGEMAGFDALAMQRYPTHDQINHFHHAGNSSGIVDGASVTMIGTKAIGESLGIQPRARIVAFAVIGDDPTMMLTAPGPASKKALKKAGMEAGDIDLVEINEAFAAVPLKFMDDMGYQHDIVNVNGGAIAMGHPLGATGSMILGTLLDELERQDKQLGLATLCIGGGMGIATIIERV